MEKKRFPLLPTYELALKCSNLFNLLDARGAISVTERVGVIGRIREPGGGRGEGVCGAAGSGASALSSQLSEVHDDCACKCALKVAEGMKLKTESCI